MKKCFIFDLDDTLVKTNAKVIVRRGSENEIICKLTPKQFDVFELEEEEFFDFTEFRADNFIKEGKETFLIHLAKEVYDEGHDVYILTAREEDSAEAIEFFLGRFDIKAKTIYCVGGSEQKTSQEKRKVLLTLMEGYDKIFFYDDSQENIEKAPSCEKIRKYHLNTEDQE